MNTTIRYRSVTYKDASPIFGKWTDLQSAYNEAKACTDYGWVENEFHERITKQEMTADEILRLEG
jgi:hypothetical protein